MCGCHYMNARHLRDQYLLFIINKLSCLAKRIRMGPASGGAHWIGANPSDISCK